MNVQIEESWKEELKEEFSKPYFEELVNFLKKEKSLGKQIFPKGSDIFNAFQHTPFQKVKVVLLGQDPYHGVGQAHGLSFSVPKGILQPPSLKNIFKEIAQDLEIEMSSDGDLLSWAKQGVLLLNASLTVEMGKASSHANIGWHIFTDAVIEKLSQKRDKLVFILWGNFAKKKIPLIDETKHLILTAVHPSPLSAHNGFFGIKHFSKVNEFLISNGMEPIDWKI